MGQPGNQPFPWLPFAVIGGLVLLIGFAVFVGLYTVGWPWS